MIYEVHGRPRDRCVRDYKDIGGHIDAMLEMGAIEA